MGKKVIQSLDNDLKGYGAIPVNDYAGLSGDVQGLTSQMADIVTDIKNFPLQIPETGDSARIQRAIDYLYNKYGQQHIGKIKFPAGLYSIDSEINLRNNGLIIEGDGSRPNGTIFRATTSITNMFLSDVDCNHGIVFERCRIDGNNLASNGINILSTGETSLIKDVFIQNCLVNGLWTRQDTAPFTVFNVSIMSCKNGIQINGGHTYSIFTLSMDGNETPILITGGSTVSLNLNIVGFKVETSYTGPGNTNYLSNDIIVFDNVGGCKLNLFGLTTYSNAVAGQTHPLRNSLVKIKNTAYGDNEPSIMIDGYYLDTKMVYVIDNDNGIKIPRSSHYKGDTIVYGRSLGALGGKEGYVFGNAVIGKSVFTGDYELVKDIVKGAYTTLYVDATTGNDTNDGSSSGTALATFNKALSKIPLPITVPLTINVTSDINEEVILKNITVAASGSLTLNFNSHQVKDIFIQNCNSPQIATGSNNIDIKNCNCTGTGTTFTGANVRIENSTVTFENLSCTDVTKTNAISINHFSKVGLYSPTISNKTGTGIAMFGRSYAMINTLNGATNNVGLSVNEFSQVAKNFTYPGSFATTQQTTSQGGTIA